MRPSLLALVLVLAAGCANGGPQGVDAQTEQFLVALDACLPAWFMRPPILAPSQGLISTTLSVTASDFGSTVMRPFQCVLDAGSDCVRVRACYGLESAATTGPCAGAAPRCDGDTLLMCAPESGSSPTQIGRVDCTRQGLSCLEAVVDGTPRAMCARALCTVAGLTCEGDAFVSCTGAFELLHSPPAESVCREVDGEGREVGTGAPCIVSDCAGDVARICDTEVGRLRAETDCGRAGLTCSETDGVHCAVTSSRCADYPLCEGDTLRYCGLDGERHDYDCVAHGYAGCETRHEPTSAVTLGRCAPRGARF